MIKIKIDKIKIGDVIAEHIINSERQILLSAGTVLSQKTLTLLQLWGIKEIRIREEKDTDDDIHLSIQFDEIVQKNRHLFESLNKPEEIFESPNPPKSPIVLSSIISKKSLEQYDDITDKISRIFIDIENFKDGNMLFALANIICHYSATTPCVMGYTLQRNFKNLPNENVINHSMSVAIVSAKIAKLLNYSPEQINIIVLGALLHDIGKTKLPPHIAKRTGYISPADEALYQSHVQTGYDLVKSLRLPREVILILVQHHEYNDGSGFPLHIKAGKIHPYAQIVAFADMFDTLAHENDEIPNFFDIRTKLTTSGANKINTQIIDTFDHYLNDFIFNVNVELSDDRKGEIIYTHPFYKSFIVRTTEGDFVDLSKNKTIQIKKSFL